VIVIDSSVVIDAFLEEGCAEKLKDLLQIENFAAPDHILLEVLFTLRRLEKDKDITSVFADHCIEAFQKLPIVRYSCQYMTSEIWRLRHNIRTYDAPFVILAEELDAALLTHDKRLARAASQHIKLMSLI
jgi:predicted nucleic acid-binding protein